MSKEEDFRTFCCAENNLLSLTYQAPYYVHKKSPFDGPTIWTSNAKKNILTYPPIHPNGLSLNMVVHDRPCRLAQWEPVIIANM